MKITLSRNGAGELLAYVPKKDLEAAVIASDRPAGWGGIITLDNGWRFDMPAMADDTPLPLTVEARKLSDEA